MDARGAPGHARGGRRRGSVGADRRRWRSRKPDCHLRCDTRPLRPMAPRRPGIDREGELVFVRQGPRQHPQRREGGAVSDGHCEAGHRVELSLGMGRLPWNTGGREGPGRGGHVRRPRGRDRCPNGGAAVALRDRSAGERVGRDQRQPRVRAGGPAAPAADARARPENRGQALGRPDRHAAGLRRVWEPGRVARQRLHGDLRALRRAGRSQGARARQCRRLEREDRKASLAHLHRAAPT